MRNNTTEKWISGIREVLSQLFILGAIGSLFIFVPLRSQESQAQPPVTNKARPATAIELSKGNASDWDQFVSWLTRAQ